MKEEVVTLPPHWHENMAPGKLGVEDNGGWVCCIPNQFSSHIGVTVSSDWMPF